MSDLQVGGAWDALQGNFTVRFDIQQTGTRLDGGTRCHHSHEAVRSLAATGNVINNHFEFIVTWNNGTKGKYVGLQDAGGKITGVTVDLLHPDQHAEWTSSRSFPLTR